MGEQQTAGQKAAHRTNYTPYLAVVPTTFPGFAVGILAALWSGMFSAFILGIADAELWMPRLLFRPLGLVGLIAGAVVGILIARAYIRDFGR